MSTINKDSHSLFTFDEIKKHINKKLTNNNIFKH